MKDGIWQLLAGIILVAILYVLVKPPAPGKVSPAAGAIEVVSGTLADMISLAVNGTQRNE